jgi:N-methylhydantoinase B
MSGFALNGDGDTKAPADPITVEVIRHSLVSAAELMRLTLARAAYSSIIYEAVDFCCAVYDKDRRLLGQGRSLPLWLGTMHFCIEASVNNVGGESALRPGDVLLHTGAYETGSHAQDLAIIVPAFLDGKLIGYATTKAHQMDMAAKHPYCMDTTDIFQEGVIFPGVRLFRGGERVDDMWRTLLANTRLPQILEGDVAAVIASAHTGANALANVVRKFGVDVFDEAVGLIFDRSEASVRRKIQALPDGRYHGASAIDNDGVLIDELIPFDVYVDINGTGITVDLSTAPAQRGGPVNCPLPSTVSAARFAILSLIARTEEINEGHFRPIDLKTREGTIFHPRSPAPIFDYFVPGMIAIDTIHLAMSPIMPGETAAGSGGDLGGIIAWNYTDDGDLDAIAADHPTGQGATATGDGAPPMTHISCSGGRNTPIEIFESRFGAIVVDKVELVMDSGGSGEYRGGLGAHYCYRALQSFQVTSGNDRQRTPPEGLWGGGKGLPNLTELFVDERLTRTISKVNDMTVTAGAFLKVRVGGGGGYGDAAKRDPNAVHDDIRNGYVSEAAARDVYPHAFLS